MKSEHMFGKKIEYLGPMWCRDNEKKEELNEQEGQIPFLDFMFFPVAEDVLDLAEIDNGNPEKIAEELFDFEKVNNLDLKSGHNAVSEFSDPYSFEDEDSLFIGDTTIDGDFDKECSVATGFERSISSSSLSQSDNTSSGIQGKGPKRFKPLQKEKWNVRFNEFIEFVKENGHGAIPYKYPSNPLLARWVKRQRRQYKLMQDKKTSTMTPDRVRLLSSKGFIWDTHEVNWREKIDALKQFRIKHGHCNVPTKYKDQNKLGTWVKYQRRHHKLYWEGKPSSMNIDRIEELEKLGFEWEIRSMAPANPEDKRSFCEANSDD